LNQVKEVDAFVTGIGTGGTLIGIGKILKEYFPNMKIYGVWAKESFGVHKIEGISDGFVPKFIKEYSHLIDGFIEIASDSAIDMAKKLAKKGYFVGISSGANFLAAKTLKNKYKNVLTIFPDNAYRYFSESFKC
jgi:cysteine synthase A